VVSDPEVSSPRSTGVRYMPGLDGLRALAVLSVMTDSLVSWIMAGQALERVWLTATGRGPSLAGVLMLRREL